MNKKRNKDVKRGYEEKGFILVVGVIIMSFLLLLALPLLFELTAEHRLTNKAYKSSAALSLAEAGVERAVWELNYGDILNWSGDDTLRTMSISSFQASGGDVIGDINIRVHEPDADDPIVEGTGRVTYIGSKKIVRTVRSVLGGYPPFKFAAFGDDGILIDQDVLIDSYDSRDGSYANPGNEGSDGDIGTNSVLTGGIYIDEYSGINGDAFSGHDSDPDDVITIGASSNIYGVTDDLPAPVYLPPILPPPAEVTPWMGDYSMSGQDTIFVSGQFESFTMGANSEVTIQGDVTLHITGDFYIDQNSRLDIADGSSLTIFMGDGCFDVDQTSTINNLSEDPTKLLIFGTEQFTADVYLDQSTAFYGAIYAPQAHVELDQNAGFYGAIIANDILFDQTTVLHYDKALEELEILPSMGALYEVKSWQVKFSE